MPSHDPRGAAQLAEALRLLESPLAGALTANRVRKVGEYRPIELAGERFSVHVKRSFCAFQRSVGPSEYTPVSGWWYQPPAAWVPPSTWIVWPVM